MQIILHILFFGPMLIFCVGDFAYIAEREEASKKILKTNIVFNIIAIFVIIIIEEWLLVFYSIFWIVLTVGFEKIYLK